MDSFASLLTEIGGWLTSAGLLGIFFTLASREHSEWRARVKERKAIVLLLVQEIRHNDSTLETMANVPFNITHGPHKDFQFKV